MAPQEEGPNWRRYAAAVLRFKWLILLVTAAGTVGGVFGARLLPARYVTQATIWVETRGSDRGPIRSERLLEGGGWVDLLKSYVVLDAVVRELRLYVTPHLPADSTVLSTFGLQERFRPGTYNLEVADSGRTLELRTSEGILVQRGVVGDSVGTAAGFAWVPPIGALRPGRVVKFTVLSPRDAAIKLAQNLSTSHDRFGNFLRLQLTGSSPSLIAATVNATAKQYIDVAAELKREKLTELTRILSGQLEFSARKLREAEIALEDFRVRTITLPSERATPLSPGLQLTRDPVYSSYFEMKIQREQLRRDREAIGRIVADVPDSGLAVDALTVIHAAQQSTTLSQALAELNTKRAELRGLRSRYTDENPQVRRLADDMRQLEYRDIPAIAQSLMRDLAARETELDERITSGSRDLEEIPTRVIVEARLRRDVAIAENLYTSLQQRYSEARLGEASSIPDLRVLDKAVVPREPLKDRAMLVILGGIAGGFGLGLAGAVLLDRMDRRVRYPEQVTDELGLSILGAVPRLKSGNGKNTVEAAQTIEALRGIRLALSHAYGAAGPLLVTITSPGAGDGKSFIASNLALAFADAGYRTLLIDGDVRRGGLHRLLSAKRKPGLTDHLQGAAEREQILQATRHPSLHFIGCGTRRQSAPELLASPAMTQLLLGLRSSFGVILVDSPPLGAGVDPFILGAATGNLVLVVRTGVTDRELAEAKLDALDQLPVRVLGAILNDVRPGGAYRYYGYSYVVEGYELQEEEALEAKGSKRLPETV